MLPHNKDNKLILVLFGSPHRNGPTAALLDGFLRGVGEQARVEIVRAYDEQITPCTDCGYCSEVDGCSSDDFDRIDALLRQADFLVVATPVYNLSFPAPLKAVFDRTQRYYAARFKRNIKPPIEKPKNALLLLSCGSPDCEGADIIRRQLQRMFTVMNTKLVGEVVLPGTDDGPDTASAVQNAREIGRELEHLLP